MNRRLFGAFGVLAVLAFTVGGCKNDPLSDLDGEPSNLVTNFSYLQMPIGARTAVNASVLDARATPLEVPITFTACTADITVATDTGYHPVPVTSAQVIVTAVSPNPSCVRVAGGGLEDTVAVAVLPPSFSGAFSSATVAGGDTLVIASTSQLKFDTATVAVTFGGGSPGSIVAKSADTIKVLVPFGADGTLTIEGITVTYAPGVVISLPTTNSVTQTGDAVTGADEAFATAPAITVPAPGQSSFLITNFGADNADQCAETAANFDFGSTGPCVIYSYTVADTTDLTFTVDWEGDADLDTYSCASADPLDCFEDGGAGATGDHPQEFSFTVPPGTHYFVVENFDGAPTPNIFVRITNTTSP
jgi:hypothetical protein